MAPISEDGADQRRCRLEPIRRRLALGRMRLAVDALPFVLVEGREEGITLGLRVDPCQVKPLRLPQRLGVQLRTADQHQLGDALLARPLLGTHQRGIQIGEGFRAVELQIGPATDHEVSRPGSGRPSESQVLRPMMIGLPRVMA